MQHIQTHLIRSCLTLISKIPCHKKKLNFCYKPRLHVTGCLKKEYSFVFLQAIQLLLFPPESFSKSRSCWYLFFSFFNISSKVNIQFHLRPASVGSIPPEQIYHTSKLYLSQTECFHLEFLFSFFP